MKTKIPASFLNTLSGLVRYKNNFNDIYHMIIIIITTLFAALSCLASPAARASRTPVLIATIADGDNIISSRLGLVETVVFYEHHGIQKYVGPESEISFSHNSDYTYESRTGNIPTGANFIIFGGSKEQPDELHLIYKIAKIGENIPGKNTLLEQATGYEAFQLGVHQSVTINLPDGYKLTLYRQS
ncbi:hypothetical protein [Candidatus Igneacidithiobacillus taiwanensis]|uniref:hypothetical protein n=1 Tax=Candidatus Igneacidithiobacillus taiwanensis TaxID=1945924 RepID=UPI00289D25AD|nr:hypothetical protein [Candidatus Igneacidithiobacillus taiwanensis]